MMHRKRLIGIAAALALAPAGVGVAGCGGSSSSSSQPPATAPPLTATGAGTPTVTGRSASTPAASTTQATQTIRVDADPTGKLEFTQTTLTARAGKATFILRNDSAVPHNLAIEGNGVDVGPSATVTGGRTTQLVATLKPGSYEFYCAVPGHKEAGMRGTLTVR